MFTKNLNNGFRFKSSTSLSTIIEPRPLITFGFIRTLKPSEIMESYGVFVKEWLIAFPPYVSKTNLPCILTGLVLHYKILFLVLTSGFIKHVALNSLEIRQTVYQKAIFEAVAPAVRTNFSSRLEGSTNDEEYTLEILKGIRALKDSRESFDSTVRSALYGFSVDDRDLTRAYDLYCDVVSNFKSDNIDEIYNEIVIINNLTTSMLERCCGRKTDFYICTDSYSSLYTNNLGLFKYRNFTNDNYIIQERG